MLHYFLLSFVFPIAAGDQVTSIQAEIKAREFRASISREVEGTDGVVSLNPQLDRSVDEGDGFDFVFADGSVYVDKSTGRIRGFRKERFRQDAQWDEGTISRERAEALSSTYFQLAGYSDTLTFSQFEKWGGQGATFPDRQNHFRLIARRIRNGIRIGLHYATQFEIDSRTGQLLGYSSLPEPSWPTIVSANITRDQALGIALQAAFAERPSAEVTEFIRCERTLWVPSIFKGSPGLSDRVRRAIEENQSILVYETIFQDLTYGEERGAYAYYVVDAHSGELIIRNSFDRGLGGGPSKAPLARQWGPGPFAVYDGKAFRAVKLGHMVAVKDASPSGPGKQVILRSGKIILKATFHEKEGLLSRSTSRGQIFAKPNKSLLSVLRRVG